MSTAEAAAVTKNPFSPKDLGKHPLDDRIVLDDEDMGATIGRRQRTRAKDLIRGSVSLARRRELMG